MGGRAGNLLAQFLTPLLAVAVLSLLGWQTGGWRLVLAGYGILGLVWSVLFVWFYRDDAERHPRCNAAEREFIGHTPATKTHDNGGLELALGVVLSPEVWLISIMGIAVNVGWVFLATWLPRFLIARHGSELATYVSSTETLAGMLTAAVGLGGMLGSFTGGAAADRFVKLYGLKWGRRLPGLTAGIVAGVLYLVAMQLTSVWPLVALMIAISFTIDYGLGAIWASYQDIGGRHVATVLGIGNMFGNWGAAGFGYYIGVLAKADRWPTVFLIASLAMLIYASGWLLFDARRTVIREPS
jgi:nitrate/nitrite transporter NarK